MEESSASKAEIFKAGPWGGKLGRKWDMGAAKRLLGLNIRSGEAVDALTVLYEKDDGQIKWSPRYGGLLYGAQGGYANVVNFKDGEYLTSISGYIAPYGISGNPSIISLTFGTNFGTYGPYGNEEGTPFSCSPANGKIVGFFGQAGSLLDAIGVYVEPIKTLHSN